LILNPRAAGTGLNIVAANHVIHYNLEWNPALEDQASARAYRRGQKKVVFVHRLYYINTVDQIINERIEYKRALSETAVVGSSGSHEDINDIMAALKMSPLGGFPDEHWN
jgi:SNF2 family DNA or RNA helicase